MTKLPNKAKVVIIGGGIHGLSTAWKLSETYKNPGDIVVLEKEDIAAGASGIACGVVITTPQAIPLAPAAISSFSKTTISPGFLYVSESFQAVLKP